jgi:hypothetical protein
MHGLLSFIRQKPFTDSKVYNKLISKPIRDHDERGRRALVTLLNRVMIRHSQEEVDRDVKLPPCHISITKLPFQPMDSVRYNQVVALIRANLISTLLYIL